MGRRGSRAGMCLWCIAGRHKGCTRPWCSCVTLNGIELHPGVAKVLTQPAERILTLVEQEELQMMKLEAAFEKAKRTLERAKYTRLDLRKNGTDGRFRE